MLADVTLDNERLLAELASSEDRHAADVAALTRKLAQTEEAAGNALELAKVRLRGPY